MALKSSFQSLEKDSIETIEKEKINHALQSISVLSPREIDVLKLLAKGYSANKIAKKLHISASTVETHRKNMYKKLKLKNLTELIRFAVENGY